jgi:hypothetical protein
MITFFLRGALSLAPAGLPRFLGASVSDPFLEFSSPLSGFVTTFSAFVSSLSGFVSIV